MSNHEEQTGNFLIVWQFEVNAEHGKEFCSIYGPGGEWARLFSQASGFARTELLQDPWSPQRYVTMDWWHSRQDFDIFRRHHAAQYRALDEKCARLTAWEKHIGNFRTAE